MVVIDKSDRKKVYLTNIEIDLIVFSYFEKRLTMFFFLLSLQMLLYQTISHYSRPVSTFSNVLVNCNIVGLLATNDIFCFFKLLYSH